MAIGIPNQFTQPAPPREMTRRGLLKAGLGLSGVAGLVMPGTAAYAAVEAANDLVITDYRPVPPGWADTHRLSITVIADLHAGGPNMGLERVRQVVDLGHENNVGNPRPNLPPRQGDGCRTRDSAPPVC